MPNVQTGYAYFPDPTKGKPVFNGSVFVGKKGLDPEILGNQHQLTIVQEDGTELQVAQPIRTGAGGVPEYNGSPVKINVGLAPYSVKVLNKLGSQVYYESNSGLADLNFNVGDYGLARDKVSIQAAIDAAFANGGGTVRCDPGEVYEAFDGGIILKNGVTLDLNGSTILKTGTSVTGHVIANFESQATNQYFINAITEADHCVITVTAPHGLSVGDWVYVHGIVGMTELNKEPYQVDSVPTTSSIGLANIDSTNFTSWSSAGTIIVLDHDMAIINGTILGTGTDQGVGGDFGHCMQFFKTVRTRIEHLRIDDSNGDNVNARLAYLFYANNIVTGRFGRNEFSPTSGTFFINNWRQEENKGPLPGALPGVFFDCEPDETDQEVCKIFMNNVVTKSFIAADFKTLAGGDFGVEVQMENCRIGKGAPVTIKFRSTNNTNAKNIIIGPSNKIIIGGSSGTGIEIENINDIKISAPTIEGLSSVGDVAVLLKETVDRLFFDGSKIVSCDAILHILHAGTNTMNNSHLVNLQGTIFLTGSDNKFNNCDLEDHTLTINDSASTGNLFQSDNLLPTISLTNGATVEDQRFRGINVSYTPVFANLTESGGSATITGSFVRIGNRVTGTAIIDASAITSTSATTATTMTLPFTNVSVDSTINIVDSGDVVIGVGRIDAASNKAIMQVWTTVSEDMIITFDFVTAAA